MPDMDVWMPGMDGLGLVVWMPDMDRLGRCDAWVVWMPGWYNACSAEYDQALKGGTMRRIMADYGGLWRIMRSLIRR